MTTMMVGQLVNVIVLLAWGGLTLWASILAFRGRRYWATWMMLLGTILQFLGGASAIVAMTVAFGSISSSTSASGLSASMTLAIILALLIPLGILIFLAGLIGVCGRFGVVEARAAELEFLNQQLQDRL